MGPNPCCMPLKMGVKVITHLSMVLAVAVGIMGVRLISISLEATTNPAFHRQHLSKDWGVEPGPEWKSDLMKDPFKGLIYPEDESDLGPDGLTAFSQAYTRDFILQYSKALLVSGLLAVCAVVVQFISSYILLCFINWEGKSVAMVWIAVNCSLIFCLATCLILLVCQGNSVPAFSTDEKLFLLFVSTDNLLTIYFVWIVMAFI